MVLGCVGDVFVGVREDGVVPGCAGAGCEGHVGYEGDGGGYGDEGMEDAFGLGGLVVVLIGLVCWGRTNGALDAST